MRTLPSCILYSTDEALTVRLTRIASSTAALQSIQDGAELNQWLNQFGDTVLIADLRAPDCLSVLAFIRKEHPETLLIALGVERSDPMLAVSMLEPFATLSPETERLEFRNLLRQAIECQTLRQKNSVLEQELAALSARKSEPRIETRTLFSTPLQNFSKAQRNFDNVEMLLESAVEGLVATARVSRAGIFLKQDGDHLYRFNAGTRCLTATEKLTVEPEHPFVRWLELNTHLISRKTLENIIDPQERAMLRRMLDSLGAEIITPLHASGGIKGWILVGPRSTGIPFDLTDLEDLIGLADHISTTLEQALQYEKTALQKALAETVLHSIPMGIAACDEAGVIRWLNSTANEILQPEAEEVIGKSVEVLGSRPADLLRRSLTEQQFFDCGEWTDNRTRITVSAETRCLMDNETCVGAMMMLRDVTGAKLLREKEDQLERAAFWNELAASMSHEIRNPLVAIKTFAQLLPKRYEDPDFRSDFSKQVVAEVSQLDHIIDKINEFANPPKPIFTPLDVRKPIEQAVTRLQSELDHDNLKIHLSSDDSVLQVNGDATSLEESIYHLLKNSSENLTNKPGSRINITVKGKTPASDARNVYIIITDNGSGIDEDMRDKVFSPFSTKKARGLGLGLPIAKRAVIDHNGQMDIETSAGGTTICIMLPAVEEYE